MTNHAPPILIGGFDHPHALTGIPRAPRPVWGDRPCPTCSGRGARNEILHLDSMRCRIAACADCDGTGWKSADGRRYRPAITLVAGLPSWTVEAVGSEIEPEFAEAA